jgi:hypothetical protein
LAVAILIAENEKNFIASRKILAGNCLRYAPFPARGDPEPSPSRRGFLSCALPCEGEAVLKRQ